MAWQRRRGVRRQTPGAARHWRRAMRRGSLRNRRADGEGRRGLTTSPGHYRGAGDVTRAVGRVAGSHTVLSAWRGDAVNRSRPTANAREARRGARSIPATGVRTGRTAGTSHRPGSSRCSRVRSRSTQSSSTYSFHSLGNYETRGLGQRRCQDEIVEEMAKLFGISERCGQMPSHTAGTPLRNAAHHYEIVMGREAS